MKITIKMLIFSLIKYILYLKRWMNLLNILIMKKRNEKKKKKTMKKRKRKKDQIVVRVQEMVLVMKIPATRQILVMMTTLKGKYRRII